jgi:hypothetical protein
MTAITTAAAAASPASGVSSSTMSVFHVSRIRSRPVVPSGAAICSPIPLGACLSRLEAERSLWK